jgi:uncharacterized protein YjiS (DUF1127 family)
MTLRMAQAIHAVWLRFKCHRRRLQGLCELSSMNDYELRDIGISRCDVRAAIRFGLDVQSPWS